MAGVTVPYWFLAWWLATFTAVCLCWLLRSRQAHALKRLSWGGDVSLVTFGGAKGVRKVDPVSWTIRQWPRSFDFLLKECTPGHLPAVTVTDGRGSQIPSLLEWRGTSMHCRFDALLLGSGDTVNVQVVDGDTTTTYSIQHVAA